MNEGTLRILVKQIYDFEHASNHKVAEIGWKYHCLEMRYSQIKDQKIRIRIISGPETGDSFFEILLGHPAHIHL